MYIKSIELQDFRQYKGKQKIEFSTDPERNVTLLLGDNTSGKTTILQAFIWCLYNRANFDKSNDLLNHVVQQEMLKGDKRSHKVKVILELHHSGTDYIILREREYALRRGKVEPVRKSEVSVQYKDERGNLKSIRPSVIDHKIKEIYPEELVDYFFYDSERVQHIAERKDITRAVKQLLGLTLLENILEHIGKTTVKNTVLSNLSGQLSVKNEEYAKEAKEKFEDAEENLQRIEEQLQQKEEEKTQYERESQKIEGQLRTMELATDIQHRRDEVKKELERAEQSAKSNKENFLKSFRKAPHTFFLAALKNRALSELEKVKFQDSGIKDMNTDSIDALIERGKCVCGTEIEEGSKHYDHLIEERNNLPPQSISLLVNSYKQNLDKLSSRNEDLLDHLKNYFKGHEESLETMGKKEEELEELHTRLTANKHTLELENKNQEYKKQITRLEEDIAKILNTKGRYENILETNKTKYQNLTSTSDKNKEITEQIAYAKALRQKIQSSYDEKEKSLKGDLEKSVNDAFQEIYHGDRIVKIDDRYNVELYTKTDNGDLIVTDRSEGLKTVTNFSFVLGLINLAQKKVEEDIKQNNAEGLETETYPLVLDAPFSNTDQIHVENISRVLPQIANQLILIVMEKDWNHARNVVDHRIGRSYRLNKRSEIYTQIEREDEK